MLIARFIPPEFLLTASVAEAAIFSP